MKIGTLSDQLAISRCVRERLYEISIRLHRSVCAGRLAEIGRSRYEWRKIGNLPKQFARHARLISPGFLLLLLAILYYLQVGDLCYLVKIFIAPVHDAVALMHLETGLRVNQFRTDYN